MWIWKISITASVLSLRYWAVKSCMKMKSNAAFRSFNIHIFMNLLWSMANGTGFPLYVSVQNFDWPSPPNLLYCPLTFQFETWLDRGERSNHDVGNRISIIGLHDRQRTENAANLNTKCYCLLYCNCKTEMKIKSKYYS